SANPESAMTVVLLVLAGVLMLVWLLAILSVVAQTKTDRLRFSEREEPTKSEEPTATSPNPRQAA
ncbi:MAG: hypothetical protein ACREI3_09965, partial [Nitrospirales bacterium]